MIKSLTVTNHNNVSKKLILSRPDTSGIIVKDISGLGPPKAEINSGALATTNGIIVNSVRLGSRNIVLSLGMMWAPLIEDSRFLIYELFPIGQKITLDIETDRRTAQIQGYVESNEPNIFSNMEDTQISIICPDPCFYADSGGSTVFSGVKKMFEFPFANESLIEKKLIFGEILLDTRAILNYKGDVSTGTIITIHALGSADNITLYRPETKETFSIDTNVIVTLTGEPLQTLDDIIISTMPGDRYVLHRRKGVDTNIISSVKRNSTWFMLIPGTNTFGFMADSGEENLMVTFAYKNAYGGM